MFLSSWGEHTCLVATPNNVRGPPSGHMTHPVDHMCPDHSTATTTDIEGDMEPVLMHEDSSPSTPSANKLPQAKALQVHVYIYL